MILIMAWRNIWRNKTRSIVIMLSVAIGLFAGIAVLALYKGMMQSRIRTVIDAETAHLQLHHKEFKKDLHPAFVIPFQVKYLSMIQQAGSGTFFLVAPLRYPGPHHFLER